MAQRRKWTQQHAYGRLCCVAACQAQVRQVCQLTKGFCKGYRHSMLQRVIQAEVPQLLQLPASAFCPFLYRCCRYRTYSSSSIHESKHEPRGKAHLDVHLQLSSGEVLANPLLTFFLALQQCSMMQSAPTQNSCHSLLHTAAEKETLPVLAWAIQSCVTPQPALYSAHKKCTEQN